MEMWKVSFEKQREYARMSIISSGKDNAKGFNTLASIGERLICRWCNKISRRNWHPTLVNVHRKTTALQLAFCWRHRSAGRQWRHGNQSINQNPWRPGVVRVPRQMPPPGGISRERFKLGTWNFTRSSRTSGPTNLKEMASPAPSGRLQNVINYYSTVRKPGPKCSKGLITWKWCEIRTKDKCTAASKAASNFSSQEYQQCSN